LAAGAWPVSHGLDSTYIFFSRLAAYSIFGGTLGLSVGLASFSPANLLKGAMGGALGGFCGGLFWIVGGEGTLARMFSLSVTGLGVGLFIGLVREITKTAWLTIVSGRIPGRQFRIDKNVVNLGRSEECDVGLFGDRRVVGRHACIERDGQAFLLKDLSRREGTYLNGVGIDREVLHDSDIIRIGDYQLQFRSRIVAKTPIRIARPYYETITTTSDGGPRPVHAYLQTRSGQRFSIPAGRPIRLGRDDDNDVVLPDGQVSRHNAIITQTAQRFFIKDLGSTNGTSIGGQRLRMSSERRRRTCARGL
jgi:pSer/pThr/pTyr-binding forkhead associated (FHA) protein